MSHASAIVSHLRAAAGHARAIVSHARAAVSHLKATMSHVRVAVSHNSSSVTVNVQITVYYSVAAWFARVRGACDVYGRRVLGNCDLYGRIAFLALLVLFQGNIIISARIFFMINKLSDWVIVHDGIKINFAMHVPIH